jgi:CheY-like chemotaxis protein/two-component sensor histidine kinase
LSSIEKSGRHQLALINDLLDLSKIEAGGFQPKWRQISLVEVISEVIEIVRASAEQNEINLQFDDEVDVDRLVTDKRRFRQMVLNLVGNAIKYTPPGGTISVDLSEKATDVLIVVTDNGIGISEESLPSAFQPFFRLDTASMTEPVGSGLGLNLTLRLANALGGRIEVQSTIGKGSSFTIILPRRLNLPDGVIASDIDWAPIDPPAFADRERSEPYRVDSDGRPLPGCDVLLVDDNLTNVEHVRDYLKAKGHRVRVAETGTQAIEMAAKMPDIIFMDIQMPEMDGIEAIRRLRKNEATRHLHIVALTSFAMADDRTRCLDAGADDFQTKPISLRKLLELVETQRPSGLSNEAHSALPKERSSI